MHYYQFNIADYRKDTTHLTLLEHGIYRSLIDTYYLDEQPLCGDDAILMRTHSIRTEVEKEALQNVLSDFFKKTKKGYVHKNCDSQLKKYAAKSEKARASAQARWNANALRTQSEGNANHKPLTINHNKKDKCTDEDYALAEFIYKSVLRVAEKTPTPNYKKWANDIRLMRESDGHTLEEIQAVFLWANSDHFWSTNILSTSSLRKQFGKLHAQMEKKPHAKSNGIDFDAISREFDEEESLGAIQADGDNLPRLEASSNG